LKKNVRNITILYFVNECTDSQVDLIDPKWLNWLKQHNLNTAASRITMIIMTKFDGIKGQELLDVEEEPMEITMIFKDNRFLFVKIENGNLVTESVPE
jgi:hypothetical protein